MFSNYLATALRNLVRNRLYAAINIVGLAVGLAAALLIGLFVRDEFSYDTWLPAHQRTYVLTSVIHQPGAADDANDRAPLIAAALLKQDFQEIEAVARIGAGPGALRRGDVDFSETLAWADPDIFRTLALPAVAGDPATALDQPDGLVITRAIARKYFGRDNPIGEVVELDRKTSLRVTAVLEDLPSNTHLNLSIIASGRNAASFLTFAEQRTPPRGGIPTWATYVRLTPGADAEKLRTALPGFVKRYPRFESADVSYSLDLVPVAAMHLRAPVRVPIGPRGSRAVIYGASAIAALILTIAAINFTNLTAAQAIRRAVEVGVRKVSGAERRTLLFQFIGESVVYAALGMIAAAILTYALLPGFNGFLQRTIHFAFLRDASLTGIMVAIVLAVGVSAGAYPALMMSRFSPAGVLKGAVRGFRAGRGRQMLVAAQFAILIALALIATEVTRQSRYAMNEALRFDKDQMLVVAVAVGQFAQVPCETGFTTQVRALPGVRGAVCSSNGVVAKRGGEVATDVTGVGGASVKSNEMVVDYGFFELYGLKPLAGRFFSRDTGDAASQAARVPRGVVINESLSRALGYANPMRAVGESVRWRPMLPATPASMMKGAPQPPEGGSEIVGVVPDFDGSARAPMAPTIYWIHPEATLLLNVKLAGDQAPETLAAIDRAWKDAAQPRAITRYFLDRAIEAQYRDVALINRAMGAFATVAMFIACLGLFGLAALAAEARTKEIGIRKAMGASTASVLALVLWEFSRPVLWGSLIAWPLAYLAMNRWLETFADRVDMGLWLFPAVSLLALLIAGLTVSSHALRVARTRPASALRYE